MINTDIYGTSEEWRDSFWSDSSMQIKNKRANFGNGGAYLRLGVLNNKLSYSEPIDKSLSYCGMDSNAPLSNIKAVAYNTNTGDCEVVENWDNPVTNFAFFERISATGVVDGFQTMYGKMVYHNRDTRYKFWANGDSPSSNCNYNQMPITKLVPKNQVMLIYVVAYDSSFSSTTTRDLNSYITSYKNTYPNIVSVFGRFYYGEIRSGYTERSINAGTGNPSNYDETLGLMLLDKINFSGAANPQSYDSVYDNCYSLFERFYYNNIPLLIADDRAMTGVYLNDSNNIGIIIGDNIELHQVNTREYIPYITYSELFKELCLQAAAYFGLFFTDREETALHGNYNDEHMYLGVIDEEGITHGQYTQGSNNVNNPIYNWNDMQESNYDYTKAVDPNKYSHSTTLGSILTFSGTGEYFAIDPMGNYNMIGQTLNDIKALTYDPATDGRKYLYQEPLQNIKNAKRIFLRGASGVLNPQSINLGREPLPNAIGYYPTARQVRYNLGTCTIFEKYKDFRDFEPYTAISLYVPYCGKISLPCNIFMGHECTVYLNCDLVTGDLEAIIFADNIEITSMTGNASQELGVSALAKAEYEARKQELTLKKDSGLVTSIRSILGNVAGATISYAFKNIGGVISQGVMAITNMGSAYQERKEVDFQLEKNHPDIVNLQLGTANIEYLNSLEPFIMIARPIIIGDEKAYAKTIGRTCNVANKLFDGEGNPNFNGLTVCSDAILDGISCTQAEKEMILDALAEGIIMPEES